MVVFGADNPRLPRLAMTAGAAGFAPRSRDVGRLLSTCTKVADGNMVFPFLDVRDLQKDSLDRAAVQPRAHDPRSALKGANKSRAVKGAEHLDQYGEISPVKSIR